MYAHSILDVAICQLYCYYSMYSFLQTLYTQANGVEVSSTMSNAFEHITSSPSPSTESPVIAPEKTSTEETKDACKGNQDKSVSRPPTVASSEVIDRRSSREGSDGQADALESLISSSCSKGLGIKDSKEDDVITSWEWQSEEGEELDQELNPNCSKSTRSIVSDNRLVLEEVVFGKEAKRCNANTAGDNEGRVLGCRSQKLRSHLVAAGDEGLLVDNNIHNSSDAARVSCVESFRLLDFPDDQAKGFSKKVDNSGEVVNGVAATGTNTEDKSAESDDLPYGPEEGSSSAGACIAQAGDESTVMEQLTEEEYDARSVPVEEAEERPFSSSDCVVCQVRLSFVAFLQALWN